MMRAMWSAAAGMNVQTVNMDTISNNLANINTTGFKKSRAEFQDLLYQTINTAGTNTSTTTTFPGNIQIGHGARLAAMVKEFTTGSLKSTSNQFDMAIEGSGFFRVTMPDGTFSYTRDGSFSLDQNGNFVTANGNALDPQITIPQDAMSVTIATDGTVSVINPAGIVITTIAVGTNPSGVAVSSTGPTAGVVYVTNNTAGTVSVINPLGIVVNTITVGTGPQGVAISTTGSNAGYAYVANSGSGTVSVINPAGRVVDTIAVGTNPQGVAVSTTGATAGYVYVANGADGTVSVINPAGVVVNTIDIGAFGYGVAVSPAGANAGNVYITNFSNGTVSVISA